jgi:4a-hydroxytetrahydrobiopterin dehydratase
MLPLRNLSLLTADFDFRKILPDWQVAADAKSLSREFIFQDFRQAFEFMSLCAHKAEELDHHPDWSNSWNRVCVTLSTHSHQGITELDLSLAQAMDQFAQAVLSR